MSATVYLAGPDVFLAGAEAIGARKKAICRAHGFDALFPLDDGPDATGLEPRDLALAIFDRCVAMMDASDLVIANMTPFRGISMDVGTAVELGYMHARGKPVFGYTNVVDDYHARVDAAGFSGNAELVERFGFVDNLMCEGAVLRSGAEVVRTRVPRASQLTSLAGFERCVVQARDAIGH